MFDKIAKSKYHRDTKATGAIYQPTQINLSPKILNNWGGIGVGLVANLNQWFEIRISLFFGETERESWFESFFGMIRFKIDSRIKVDSRIKKDLRMTQRSYLPPQLKTETSSSHWGRGSEGKEFRAGKEGKKSTSLLTKILNLLRFSIFGWGRKKPRFFLLKRFANQGWFANQGMIRKSKMIRILIRVIHKIDSRITNQKFLIRDKP